MRGTKSKIDSELENGSEEDREASREAPASLLSTLRYRLGYPTPERQGSSSGNADPKMGSVASRNTPDEKFDPKMGSVTHRSVSPTQNSQFQKNTDLDSRPPTFSHRGAFTYMPEDDLLGDNSKDGDLRGETYDDLLARMQTAAGDFRMSRPVTDEFASDVPAFTDPSGDFRYLPTLRQQQASPGISDELLSSERPGFFPNRMANNPSLRSNNGYPISQGEANGEMRVADCALTPTSQAHYDGEGTRGAHYDRGATEDSGVVPDRFRQGRESLSVRNNVTIRESKRPKARASDQEYRRSSMSPSTARQSFGTQLPVHHSDTPGRLNSTILSEAPTKERNDRVTYSPNELGKDTGGTGPIGFRYPTLGTRYDPNSAGYAINLSHGGRLVRHLVTPDTRVTHLSEDAATIYGLNAQDLILVLFGMYPQTLSPQNLLSGPPVVGPNATVLVFNINGMAGNHTLRRTEIPPELPHPPVQQMFSSPGPKFCQNPDSTLTARTWPKENTIPNPSH
jgi:hypothetical protein